MNTLEARVARLETKFSKTHIDINWVDRRLDEVIDGLSPLEKDILVLLRGGQAAQIFKQAFQAGQIPDPDLVLGVDPILGLQSWFLRTVFDRPIPEPARWIELREFDAIAEILKRHDTIPPAWDHVNLEQLTLPEYLALRAVIAKAMSDPDSVNDQPLNDHGLTLVNLAARLLYRTYRVTADHEEVCGSDSA